MDNNIWMIGFLIKKKLVWLLGICVGVYLLVFPYQKNLLLLEGDYEKIKQLFWDTAFLYHSVFAITLVLQGIVQLINSETKELFAKYNPRMMIIGLGIFLIYEVLVFPLYIWYLLVYPNEGLQFLCMLVYEFVAFAVFSCVSMLTKQPLISFLSVFIVLLGLLA